MYARPLSLGVMASFRDRNVSRSPGSFSDATATPASSSGAPSCDGGDFRVIIRRGGLYDEVGFQATMKELSPGMMGGVSNSKLRVLHAI